MLTPQVRSYYLYITSVRKLPVRSESLSVKSSFDEALSSGRLGSKIAGHMKQVQFNRLTTRYLEASPSHSNIIGLRLSIFRLWQS